MNLLMATLTDILTTLITPFGFLFGVNILLSPQLRGITLALPILTIYIQFCFQVQLLMKLKSGAKAEAFYSFGRGVVF